CIQCCTNPTCEPHREAREALRKNQSILDGNDIITRLATQKRKCKVAKGAFHESNIQYFGETVVIWNIREFMNVTKWREDAIRRSKRKVVDNGGIADGIGRGVGGKKRGRNNDDDSSGGVDAAITAITPVSKKPKLSRRKKFTQVCQVLLENSLK
ncbi:hypothetical protein ACHAWC_004101, partial [Mediolabrus comicus]